MCKWVCYDRDDQIILTGLGYYIVNKTLAGASRLPIWNTNGVVITASLHAGPVEFLYYWLHRALHHHFLYSRYHSHHHSSIVTQPVTGQNIYIFIQIYMRILMV